MNEDEFTKLLFDGATFSSFLNYGLITILSVFTFRAITRKIGLKYIEYSIITLITIVTVHVLLLDYQFNQTIGHNKRIFEIEKSNINEQRKIVHQNNEKDVELLIEETKNIFPIIFLFGKIAFGGILSLSIIDFIKILIKKYKNNSFGKS